jgi:geranylgeranyl diphosphate synthase type I
MSDLERKLAGMPERLARFYLKKLPEIRRGIDEFFPRVMDRRFLTAVTGQEPLFEPDYAVLSDTVLRPTHEYLDRGGKMLRPVLVALTLEAYGVDSSRFPLLLGAIEVMEDSSIMMDDTIDNSELRRGGPCAHVAHGYAVANVSACAAFSLSHVIFNDDLLGVGPEKTLRLLHAVAFEHIQMGFGQMEELFWTAETKNTVSVAQYLQETIARCAFLSFRGPLRYAGIIAGAPDEDIPVLERLGDHLLIGYHVRGDNLDMSPESEGWGKIAGEDITTGRRTLLINHVLEQASPEDRATIERVLDSRTRDEAEKRRVYELVIRYGGLPFARDLAARYNDRAHAEIEALHVPEEYKAMLCEFSDFSTVRRRM